MKEFVEFLVTSIVSQTDQIEITQSNEMDINVIKVKVAPEDMGALIGKEGRVIKSIRSLVRAKSIKDGVRVSLELVDDNANN